MNILPGNKSLLVSKVVAVKKKGVKKKKVKAKGERKRSYSSLTERQVSLLEKQLIDSEGESQIYDSQE